ncbi:hypothetical protein [Paenibacillus xerothermodurans]|uniref:Hydrolase n=1 Tax=Paenibacillus xerothermodurans TaxID=1977292 RepID=A0A2W1NGA0_PAEXE|nr:hypothetical protein [Paenibacillus xerothermodurans]PZE22111.1 hypothetical protein CBW46_006905 [Paenibacillus xerothermodurans]
MPKTLYYVSVANGLIQDETTMNDALQDDYEFRIRANDEEIRELRELMQKVLDDEENTHIRAPIPYKSAEHDKATEDFNSDMLNMYNMIYQLGDDKAKRHIEQTGILGRLLNPDYHDAGYGTRKDNGTVI